MGYGHDARTPSPPPTHKVNFKGQTDGQRDATYCFTFPANAIGDYLCAEHARRPVDCVIQCLETSLCSALDEDGTTN